MFRGFGWIEWWLSDAVKDQVRIRFKVKVMVIVSFSIIFEIYNIVASTYYWMSIHYNRLTPSTSSGSPLKPLDIV